MVRRALSNLNKRWDLEVVVRSNFIMRAASQDLRRGSEKVEF